MTDKEKILEAIGDGLLLGIARLYLYDRRKGLAYASYQTIITRIISNEALAIIAHRENIKPVEGVSKPYAKAFEIEIARRYFNTGFHQTRFWLYELFEKYLDVPNKMS